MNLRARLVSVILLALLPAFLLLLAVSQLERTRAYGVAAEQTIAISRLMRNQYAELVQANHVLLQWVAQFPEIRTGGVEVCNTRLQSLFSALKDYRGISVADLNGDIFCVASLQPVTTTINNAQRPYFQLALKKKDFVVGGVEIGSVSHRPNLTFGYPILDAAGNVTRVLGLGAEVDAMNRRLLNADFPEDAAILVLSHDGTVILRNPAPQEYVGEHFPIEQLISSPDSTEGVGEMTGLDGIDRMYAYSQVRYRDEPTFYVLVGYSSEMIYGGVSRTLRASLIGLSFVSLVALAAAWLSAETMIIRRIKLLAATAHRMREGDLSARTGLGNQSNEFGQLAASLDAMAASLEQRNADNEQLIAEMSALNADLEQRVDKRTQQLVASITKLRDSQSELRRLSQELMRVTEQERARISREIHDQLGQMLTAIKMELRTAKRRLANPPETLVEDVETKLDDISTRLDEMVVLVRRISADLRPGILDDFGLQAAVEWQLQEFEKNTGISHSVDAVVNEDEISPVMATAAFRILQEALTNVARHSEATHVSIEVTTEENRLILTVKDNGKGIPPEKLLMTRSLGLVGMRERAAELNGTVTIRSEEAGGTLVTLVLPLAGAELLPNGEQRDA